MGTVGGGDSTRSAQGYSRVYLEKLLGAAKVIGNHGVCPFGPGSCDFESGPCGWRKPHGNWNSWDWKEAATTLRSPSPKEDHTLGTNAGSHPVPGSLERSLDCQEASALAPSSAPRLGLERSLNQPSGCE